MKKWIALALALVMALSVSACGSGSSGGKVAVFWYDFEDAYLSSVRQTLDQSLTKAGVSFQDYDAKGSQTAQIEQIQSAIAEGVSALAVNIVEASSDEATQTVVDMAKEAGLPLVFFNRSVPENIVSVYEKAAYVGTDYTMAGHMQGQMIGDYLVNNYDAVDLNGDGIISYVLFKGQEGNAEANARTQYSVGDANRVLSAAGKPALSFYDPNNSARYLVDQTGAWSEKQGQDYMQTILTRYCEAEGDMVELVIANNDDMALGAIDACEEAGLDKNTMPFIVGVDATPPALEALREGTLKGTVRNDASGLAQSILDLAVSLSAGGEPSPEIELTDGRYVWLEYEAVTAKDLKKS